MRHDADSTFTALMKQWWVVDFLHAQPWSARANVGNLAFTHKILACRYI